MHKTRNTLLLLHRYVGLSIAVFLIIVAFTGSLLAFYNNLDGWINPHIRGFDESKYLDPGTLALRAEKIAPEAQVDSVWLGVQEAASIGVSQRKNGMPLDYDQILINPLTGDELERRNWGDITQGIHNLMPFIYKIHYALALGSFGGYLLGIVALLWTIDCFVSFYLTLPRPRRIVSRKNNWWRRWKAAWLIKTKNGYFRFNFDLHRAFGLWAWLMLFIFALSSVALNLRDEVYKPVMSIFFEFDHEPEIKQSELIGNPALDWQAGYLRGNSLLLAQGKKNQFQIERYQYFGLDRNTGTYTLCAKSSLDTGKYGSTIVTFDANSGALVSVSIPGHQATGDVITNWLVWLHTASVFGFAMQVIVCIIGIGICVLTVTGGYVWWRKQKALLKR